MGVPAATSPADSNGFDGGGRMCAASEIAWIGEDDYWKFHEQQEHERNHASHYADHRVPETVPSSVFLSQPSRRSTLKIVKKKGES